MSTIVSIEVPAGDFVLGATLAANGVARVSVERVVPVGECVLPYVWVMSDDREGLEAALREDPDVASFEVVDRVEDDLLVRVEWQSDVDGLLDALVETGGTVLDAVGEGDRWSMTLQFDGHDDLGRFYRRGADRGISMKILRVHGPVPPGETVSELDLTDRQEQTLITALDAGYFDVPRGASLRDLASEFGVSDTAVSQRLRRGTASVLRATLAETDDDADRRE